MISCLGCEHHHVTKDFEFTVGANNRRNDNPIGKCEESLDLWWCDIPEVEGNDFQILSFGRPSMFEVEDWFPNVALSCSHFREQVAPPGQN